MRWGGRIASYRWSTQTFFLNHTRLGSAFSSEVNSAFVVSPWTWQLKRRRRSLLPEQRRQMTARTKKWAVWSPRTITSKFPFKELIFSRLFVQEAQEIRSKTWHQGFGHKMLRGVYIEFWKQVLWETDYRDRMYKTSSDVTTRLSHTAPSLMFCLGQELVEHVTSLGTQKKNRFLNLKWN